MANTILAGSPQQTYASRIERGLRLFEEPSEEIHYVTPHILLPERRDVFLTTAITEMIACVEGIIEDIARLP